MGGALKEREDYYSYVGKHIYKYHNKYCLRVKNKDTDIYEQFDTLSDAKRRRYQLIKEDIIHPRRDGRPYKDYDDRYVYCMRGKYYILKRVQGKTENFGVFTDKASALMERDRLERHNWVQL